MESYLDTALARLRSGWRIKWLPFLNDKHGRGAYVVYGPHGDQGATEKAGVAAMYYMEKCDKGPQQPLTPMWHDVLPLPKDDEVSVVAGDHEPALYDGVPRGP